MEPRYLIDTNVIIDFSENKLSSKARSFIAAIIDEAPCLSVINKIELLGFSIVTDVIIELVESSVVIGLSDEVIEETIEVRKKYKLKLPDAVIAATAIVHKLTLITRNVSDFRNVAKLKVIDPWAK